MKSCCNKQHAALYCAYVTLLSYQDCRDTSFLSDIWSNDHYMYHLQLYPISDRVGYIRATVENLKLS